MSSASVNSLPSPTMQTPSRDVLLFSGQGSSQHLTSPPSGYGLLHLLSQNELKRFNNLLLHCRDAFYLEVKSTRTEEQSIFHDDIEQIIREPESLLFPPEELRSHPVFETLSLYLHQVSELLLFQSHEHNHHVVEVAGLCTGILPAILASSFTSYDSDSFVSSAVEIFRLAFWIGLRAAMHIDQTSQGQWKNGACVLSIYGASLEDLEEMLAQQPQYKQAQVSAIFGDKNISISGPSEVLEEINKGVTGSSIQARWAHVHGIYHGGKNMEHLIQVTLADAHRRRINFLTWDLLRVPLRSVSNGLHMGVHNSPESRSLLETALRGIFIDRVDWKTSTTQICQFHQKLLDYDSAAKTRLIGLGPGSRNLVHSFKDLISHPRLERIDNWSEHLSLPVADDIAIVGLSLNYPGGSGQDKFWKLIESARSTVCEIPSSRFTMPQPAQTKGSTGSKRPKSNPKYGNFLDNPFDFDAEYFNISPREAKSIDPQQRLLLHAALEALEDAGYKPNSTPTFQTETFGVYTGVATGDYVDNLRNEIDVYYSPGTLRSFLSGRISYAFKFKGPSIVVDTACSSSLVALYQACMALRNNDCTAALAMGVNTITSPDMYTGLGRAHFLSPTGQCKPFDESADGYCRAEGCGGVVVKKLSDAINEGDHIYGVIRGIGVNQCGTAKSITHPDPETQAALIRAVLKSGRVNPQSVSVIEAHGTGTQAGDYAECSSLRSVFGQRPQGEALFVSSVKGSIGHAEAASGIAGLAKLLLMMEKKKIPPQSSYKKLNPRLEKLVNGRLQIPSQLQDWPRNMGRLPRRALLNNFGASGSNAALVLEEYIPVANNKHDSAVSKTRSHHLVNFSAKTAQGLEVLKTDYVLYLQRNPSLTIEDFCYSVNARRLEYLPYRSSIVACDRSDLLLQLKESVSLDNSLQHIKPKKTVFAFSGQGNNHVGMGADLFWTVPHFATVVKEFDNVLCDNGFPLVAPYLTNSLTLSTTPDPVKDLIISQCACFVLEYSLASMWMSWGVIPDIIVGHSIGEYAAFAIAKVIDPKEALLLVARRAQLIAMKCKPQSTGMLACRMQIAVLEETLKAENTDFAGITISCRNSPQDVVLAGPLASLEAFSKHCKSGGIKHKLLQVPFGFHSSSMDPILDDLLEATSNISLRTPSIRIGSSLYGRVLEEGKSLEPEYFVRHTREPVKFSELAIDLAKCSQGSHLTILEVGPSPSTESMFKAALIETPLTFLTSLRPSQSPWATTTQALQTFFLQNYHINWGAVYSGTSAKFHRSTPSYPLKKTPYFIPFTHSSNTARGDSISTQPNIPKKPQWAFLSEAPESATEGASSIFITSCHQISPFVNAHSVGGIPLCPASVYLEVVLQASAQRGALDSETGASIFEHIKFEHPLVNSLEQTCQNTTDLRTQIDDLESNEVMRFSLSSGQDRVHCTGRLHCSTESSRFVTDLCSRKMVHVQRLRRSLAVEPASLAQIFSTRTIYDIIFPRVVEYKDPLITLQQLTLSSSGLEGHGTFRLTPLEPELDVSYVSSPALIDTLLHVTGFMANTYVTPDVACICVSIEQVMICCKPSELYGKDLRVYCAVGDIDHSLVADAYAICPQGKLIAYAEGVCFKKIQLQSFKTYLSREARQLSGKSKTAQGIRRHGDQPLKTPRARTPKVVFPDELSSARKLNAISILREVCGLDQEPGMHHSLGQLGVDSLLLIELTELLRQSFPGIILESGDVEKCETVQDLIDLVAKPSDSVNGLSDIPSLVHTTAPSSAASVEGTGTPQSELQDDESTIIKSIFMDVCGADPDQGRDQELSLLGVDSLMAIELFEELRGRLGIEIDPHNNNISDLTYKQLEHLCTTKSSTSGNIGQGKGLVEATRVLYESANSASVAFTVPAPRANHLGRNCVNLLQANDESKPSLYMFHDGSGLCNMYGRISGLNRNLYGVYSLESPSSTPHNMSNETMEDLAARYIRYSGLLAQTEVILGGWSFGGVLAFEVSRQLVKLGKTVNGLILIDSPAPINHQPLPQSIISFVVAKGALPKHSKGVQDARARIEGQFITHAEMLRKYDPSHLDSHSKHVEVPYVVLRCVQTIDTESLCGISYPWLNDTRINKESLELWKGLLGDPISVLELNCGHFDVFDSSNVESVSQQLQKACDLIETNKAM